MAGKRIHQWQVLSLNIFIPQLFIFSISYNDGQSCLVSWMMVVSSRFYNYCPWRLPVLWTNVKIYLYAFIQHLSLWYLSTLHGLKMNSEAAWRIVSKIYLSFGFCDIMWFHWVDRGTQRNIRHFTKILKKELFEYFNSKKIKVLKKSRTNSRCQWDLNLDMWKNKGFPVTYTMTRGGFVISL